MRLHRASKFRSALVLAFTVSLYPVSCLAQVSAADPGIPVPVIPAAQGDECVEDIDYMRRNHMDLLKHQRDETMLEGIRGKPYSLKDCLDCHAVNGVDAMPVTASDPRHFCRSCHDYAAVSIDCFQCHASRPDRTSGSGAMR